MNAGYETLCEPVHKQLLAGRCPWCGGDIIQGQVVNAHQNVNLAEVERRLREIEQHLGPQFLMRLQSSLSDLAGIKSLMAIINQCASGPKKAVPLVAAVLNEDDWKVRCVAAHILGRIGPDAKQALPALTKLLSDPELLVRDAAEEAIKKIETK